MPNGEELYGLEEKKAYKKWLKSRYPNVSSEDIESIMDDGRVTIFYRRWSQEDRPGFVALTYTYNAQDVNDYFDFAENMVESGAWTQQQFDQAIVAMEKHMAAGLAIEDIDHYKKFQSFKVKRAKELGLVPAKELEEREEIAKHLSKVGTRRAAERAEIELQAQQAEAIRQRRMREEFAELPERKPLPTGEEELAGLIGEQPAYTLQQYMGQQAPKFLKEVEPIRQAWWNTLFRRQVQGRRLQQQEQLLSQQLREGRLTGEVPEPAPAGALTEQLRIQERLAGVERRQEKLAARETPEDPLAGLFKDYPWWQEFLKLPPRARGYYEPIYKPPTRWRVAR